MSPNPIAPSELMPLSCRHRADSGVPYCRAVEQSRPIASVIDRSVVPALPSTTNTSLGSPSCMLMVIYAVPKGVSTAEVEPSIFPGRDWKRLSLIIYVHLKVLGSWMTNLGPVREACLRRHSVSCAGNVGRFGGLAVLTLEYEQVDLRCSL